MVEAGVDDSGGGEWGGHCGGYVEVDAARGDLEKKISAKKATKKKLYKLLLRKKKHAKKKSINFY